MLLLVNLKLLNNISNMYDTNPNVYKINIYISFIYFYIFMSKACIFGIGVLEFQFNYQQLLDGW